MFGVRSVGRLTAATTVNAKQVITTSMRNKHGLRVFLLEDVERLGTAGQEVSVAHGYGRNFLIPYNKAMYAIERNKAVVEKFTGKPVIPLALEAADTKVDSQQYLFKTFAYSLQQVDLQFLRYPTINGTLANSTSPVVKKDIVKRIIDAGFYHINEDDIHLGAYTKLETMGAYPIAVFLQSPDHSAWVNLVATVRRNDDVYINSVTGGNKDQMDEFIDAATIAKDNRRQKERNVVAGMSFRA